MPLPLAREARTARSVAGAIFGRPQCFPWLLALAMPALTRSAIIARSNSANTPIIWNVALPAGVVVSVNRPRHDDIKLTAVRSLTQRVETRPTIAALCAADAIVAVNGHDRAAHASGNGAQLALLADGRLLWRANTKVKGGSAHGVPRLNPAQP